MHRDYSPKGVQFRYIYKALAHPEHNGYVQPYTLEERLLHVQEAQRTLGSQIDWICDSMDNSIKHALGDRPNSEFIVDPKGRIIVGRSWSSPGALREDLAQLVGRVEKPTTIQDLAMQFEPPPAGAKTGVVPRIKAPSGMTPLRIEPIAGEDGLPFYVKLRAEADTNALRGRQGKLFLSFRMDPLHHVHWNNLAAPLRFQLSLPSGDDISPAQGEGPAVDEPADLDPREFLLDVKAKQSEKPIRIQVDYFACSDDEGWCKPVRQHYVVHFERDRDGGSVRRENARDARPRGFSPGLQANNRRPGNRTPSDNRPGGLGENRLMAKVVAFDKETRTLTVRDRSGQERVVHVAENAKIRRRRENASLKDLRAGAIVLLRLQPQEHQPAQAVQLMIR